MEVHHRGQPHMAIKAWQSILAPIKEKRLEEISRSDWRTGRKGTPGWRKFNLTGVELARGIQNSWIRALADLPLSNVRVNDHPQSHRP